jgi:hypothetical protein
VEEEQRDRDHRQQGRDRKADAPEAHEIEFGVVRDDAKEFHGNTFTWRMILTENRCPLFGIMR